jgi:uncharacterized membrane protein YbhN (UPF0104 family)
LAEGKKLDGKLKVVLNLVFLGMGILLFYFVARIPGKSFLLLVRQSVDVRLHYLLAVVAAMFAQSILVAWRWRLLLGCTTDVSSLPKGFVFYNANLGLLITSFLPVLGNVGAKAASAKLEHNLPLSQTAYATMIEYLVGFEVIAVMVLPSLLYFSGAVNAPVGILVLGFLGIGLIIIFSRFYKFTLGILGRVFARLVQGFQGFLSRKAEFNQGPFRPEAFSSLDRRSSTRLVFLSLLIYLVIFLRYWIFLRAFSIPIDTLKFGLAYPLGYAVASLGITPGNLGTSELGWYGVLAASGVARKDAAIYAVGQRLLNIGAVALLAVFSYGYYLLRKRRDAGSRGK